MTIRVVLADDQPLVRSGLRVLIDGTPGIDVAAEAATGAQAVQAARDTRPDVVIMDIRMARHGRHRSDPDHHRRRSAAPGRHPHHLR
jgi:DNA-binding NarL/FixJ family response regulator